MRAIRAPSWRRIATLFITSAALLFYGTAFAQSSAELEIGVASQEKSDGSIPATLHQLLIATKALYEEPGAIMDRNTIFKILNVHPEEAKRFITTEGGRQLSVRLGFEDPAIERDWKAKLVYSQDTKNRAWTVNVELFYSGPPACYSSRAVETEWGRPFVYKPFGTRAFLESLLRQQKGELSYGPHDGVPYYAGFAALTQQGAIVVFEVGGGGCVRSISIGNNFKSEEFNDDRIYYE